MKNKQIALALIRSLCYVSYMRPKTVITLDYVIERARRCESYSSFQSRYYPLYTWARQQNLLSEIEKVLPPVSYDERARRAALTKAYTDTELIEHARQFSTRADWRAAGELERKNGDYSHYGAAVHRGKALMRECCAHMVSGYVARKRTYLWTDDELIEAASTYNHKGDWKRSANARHSAAYQSALNRPDVFKRATAHMTPKANPYAGDYVIYAFEFSDHHVYVGLTFQPKERLQQHLCRGPVFDHLRVCPNHSHKHVATGIGSPTSAIQAEKQWIERYVAEGWTLLNTSSGGSLGTVQRVNEWTKELVILEARKFATKQAWIDGSQGSYRLAKREGWFDEACAHMPNRNAQHLIGRVVSDETKAKQRAAKVGRNLSSAHKAKISSSMRKHWNPPVTSGVSEESAKSADKLWE